MIELQLRTDSKFVEIRGHAIQAYASVEFSMCMFLADLMGTTRDVAGVIFYRIVNTRSRNAILDELYRKKYGDTYRAFWKSIQKHVQALDQRRNEIIHWHVAVNIYVADDGEQKYTGSLMPPNYWGHNPNTPAISADDLKEFIARCDVVSRANNILFMHLNGSVPQVPPSPWLEIFQRPLDYPLPDGHPLCRTDTAP